MAHHTIKMSHMFVQVEKEPFTLRTNAQPWPASKAASARFSQAAYFSSQKTSAAGEAGLRHTWRVKHTFVHVDDPDDIPRCIGGRQRASSAPALMTLSTHLKTYKSPAVSKKIYMAHEHKEHHIEEVVCHSEDAGHEDDVRVACDRDLVPSDTDDDGVSLDQHEEEAQSPHDQSNCSWTGSSSEEIHSVTSAAAFPRPSNLAVQENRGSQDAEIERLQGAAHPGMIRTAPIVRARLARSSGDSITHVKEVQLHVQAVQEPRHVTQHARAELELASLLHPYSSACAPGVTFSEASLSPTPQHQGHHAVTQTQAKQGCTGQQRFEPAAGRTTVMLVNLPFRYTSYRLLRTIDSEGFAGMYDFLYVPMDYKTRTGTGKAFVNLTSPAIAERFTTAFHGFSQWSIKSKNSCHAVWAAKYQGLQANVNRYRNSDVMLDSVPDEHKPQLFSNGRRIDFPPPLRRNGGGHAALRI
eukprot:TRINITY_DN3148_c6_g1_i1.p1 TRINITY_DN3148_c6_g1~~TRINITY_DN3148_c6_g1_i1.p1  ORF type:complete len:468 (+),score=62.55 TRINITY_DN3148_c6_g1_i1:129-1532(+)